MGYGLQGQERKYDEEMAMDVEADTSQGSDGFNGVEGDGGIGIGAMNTSALRGWVEPSHGHGHAMSSLHPASASTSHILDSSAAAVNTFPTPAALALAMAASASGMAMSSDSGTQNGTNTTYPGASMSRLMSPAFDAGSIVPARSMSGGNGGPPLLSVRIPQPRVRTRTRSGAGMEAGTEMHPALGSVLSPLSMAASMPPLPTSTSADGAEGGMSPLSALGSTSSDVDGIDLSALEAAEALARVGRLIATPGMMVRTLSDRAAAASAVEEGLVSPSRKTRARAVTVSGLGALSLS
jgi:hypothetical protein